MQLFTGSPFQSTVHAPHSPAAQPFLVPVSANFSRSICSNVMLEGTSNRSARPLTVTVILCVDTPASRLLRPMPGVLAARRTVDLLPHFGHGFSRQVSHHQLAIAGAAAHIVDWAARFHGGFSR